MSYTNACVCEVYLGLGMKSYSEKTGTSLLPSAKTTNLLLLTNIFLGLPSIFVSEIIFPFSAGNASTIISLFCVRV